MSIVGLGSLQGATVVELVIPRAPHRGVKPPHGDWAGSCSSCAGKLISGSVNQEDQAFLDEEQLATGFVLTCVAIPTSDCTVETHAEEALY